MPCSGDLLPSFSDLMVRWSLIHMMDIQGVGKKLEYQRIHSNLQPAGGMIFFGEAFLKEPGWYMWLQENIRKVNVY